MDFAPDLPAACQSLQVTDATRLVLPAMRKNSKKLTLSTTTLRSLTDASLDGAAGAAFYTIGVCTKPTLVCVTQLMSICYAC